MAIVSKFWTSRARFHVYFDGPSGPLPSPNSAIEHRWEIDQHLALESENPAFAVLTAVGGQEHHAHSLAVLP